MMSSDPESTTFGAEARDAMAEMFAYAGRLAAEREQAPGDDLLSVLLAAEVDGERLTQLDVDLFFMLLMNAGSETTRNLITGGMLTLFEHPEQRDRLRDDPELVPRAVEEMLRWVTPVMRFRRTARQDTTLGEQPIAAGDKVVVWYTSANRDERQFPDAGSFDVTRTPTITSRSVAAARISASVPAWPDSRPASSSRRCSSGSRDCGPTDPSRGRGPASSTASRR